MATTIDSQLRAIAAIGPPRLPPGARVGRYEIVRQLGPGGMGIVYEARDTELGRRVALKLVKPHGVPLEEAERRLRREARAMAKLPAASCVVVYEVDRLDEQLYIAMELMPGGTLRGWMARPRRWPEVVAQLLAVGHGLAAAHAAGIVHRDFKPENVLLGARGDARIADLGLARAIGPDSLASGPDLDASASGFAGTPAYMPPEQLRGDAADERADQFSFAVTFYEALEGARPTGAPAYPRSRPPAWLRAILARALAPEPADRWPSLAAMLGAIERRVRRRRWLLVAAPIAAALIVAIGLTAVAMRRGAPAEPPRSPIAWRPDLLASAPAADALPVAIAYDGSLVYARDREWWVQARGSTAEVRHRLPDDVSSGDWAVSPHTRAVYVADGARIWELAGDGARLRLLASSPVPQVVRAGPDGRGLLVAEPDDPAREVDARVIDLATLQSRVLLPRAHLVAAAWSPDARRIAFVVRDAPAPDAIVIVDAATGARTIAGASAAPLEHVAWPAAGALVVAVAAERRSRLETWLLDGAGRRTGVAALYELPPFTTVGALTAARDALYVLTIGLDMHVFQVDLDPPAPPRRLETRAAQEQAPVGWLRDELVFVALGETQRTLALAAAGPPRVLSDEIAVAVAGDAMWVRRTDAATGHTSLAEVGHPEVPEVALPAPRAMVACAADQRAPCVVFLAGDANRSEDIALELHRWTPGAGPLGPALASTTASIDELFSLSPDGRVVAVGRACAIEQIDLATGGSRRVAEDAHAQYLATAWALDGTLYATVAIDDGAECRIVRVARDVAEIVQRDPGCSALPYGLKVRPDGKALVVHRQGHTFSLYRVPL